MTLTYEKHGTTSYFKDLGHFTMGTHDKATEARLHAHATDVEEDPRFAKVGGLERTTPGGGYAVPPLWMLQEIPDLAYEAHPLLSHISTHSLPTGSDSIAVPRVTAKPDKDAINAPVRTIAGEQGLMLQLLDQSPVMFDAVVLRDLMADYSDKLAGTIVGGTGSYGQVLGIANTTGIAKVPSPMDDRAAHVRIGEAVKAIEGSVIYMHPDRWKGFVDRAQVPCIKATNRPGGTMHERPVVADRALAHSPSGSTILVGRLNEAQRWQSALRVRAIPTRTLSVTPEGATDSLLLQLFGYTAFTAARYPETVVQIEEAA